MNPKNYVYDKNTKTFTFPIKTDLNIIWIAEFIEEDIAERLSDVLNLPISNIKDEWTDEVLKEVIKELQNRIEKRGN